MRNGVRVFTALSRDLEAMLACGWLLSMGRGTAVTVGIAAGRPGAGLCAGGFMDPYFRLPDEEGETLLRAASAQARRLAARLRGNGALDVIHEPSDDAFDLLLVARPPVGTPLSSSAPYRNADGRRYPAVLVAPRETPSRLGRNVLVLADGPPRPLPALDLARRLCPAMETIRLVLAGRTEPERAADWRRTLPGHCQVRVSSVPRVRDAIIGAVLSAGCDLLVAERPARPWHALAFARRLADLLDRTPAAILFR